MFVVVQHTFTNPQVAYERGTNLLAGNGAPRGTRVLQFLPSMDKSAAFCLWESESVDDVQNYVDSTLGDSSENACFEIDAEIARGLPQPIAA